jgi:hypothetical protein
MAKLNKSKLNKSVPAIVVTSPNKSLIQDKKEDPVQVEIQVNSFNLGN